MKRSWIWPAALLVMGAGIAGRSLADNHTGNSIRFAETACPFTIDLPGDSVTTYSGIKTEYLDPSHMVTGFWSSAAADFLVICLSVPEYKLPPDAVKKFCSAENPEMVDRSECGRAKRFDGVEIASPKTGPADGVAYFWFYVGHKESKGRFSFRVASKQKTPDEAEKKRIDDLARSLFSTIR